LRHASRKLKVNPPVRHYVARHEDVWGSGGVAPRSGRITTGEKPLVLIGWDGLVLCGKDMDLKRRLEK